MDWNSILMWSGVPDSPGRDEAVQRAKSRTEEKATRKQAKKGKR